MPQFPHLEGKLDEKHRPTCARACCYKERGQCPILPRQVASASSDLAGDGASSHEVPAAGTAGGLLEGAPLGNEPPRLRDEIRGSRRRVQFRLRLEQCFRSCLVGRTSIGGLARVEDIAGASARC